MSTNNNTAVSKKASMDLWIILIITFIVLGIYMVFGSEIDNFVTNSQYPILIRTICIAFVQFGVAGLGISVVCFLRKEKFTDFGLHKDKALQSILLSVLAFVPNIIFTWTIGEFNRYLPFHRVNITDSLFQSSLPEAILGMIFVAAAWGFFEGFNYVVITDKINSCMPSKLWWLDWGAVICAVMCILIHGAIGLTPEGIIEMFTTLIAIYGMLMARKYTGNAWGCVFVFLFLWNAY